MDETPRAVPDQKESKPSNRRRPGWVWIIFLFYVLSIGWTALSYAMVFSGAVPLTDQQRAYFDSLSWLDYVTSLGIALLNLAGVLSLFMLRQIAFRLFLAAFAVTALTLVYHSIAKNFWAAIGASGGVGAVIGWVILFAVVLYTRKLRNNGILI